MPVYLVVPHAGCYSVEIQEMTMKVPRCSWFVLSAILLLPLASLCQVSTGAQPMGSFSSGPDFINLGNLNMHFDLPVFAKPGRGMPFTYTLSFDSSVWSPVTVSGVKSWRPAQNWNWRGVTEEATGYISYIQTLVSCQISQFPPRFKNFPYRDHYQYHDQFGVIHSFDNTSGGCFADQDANVTSSKDSAGLTLTTDPNASTGVTITTRDGAVFVPPLNAGSGGATRTDRNGNQITV